jgi:hypothetical protein
LAALAEPDLIVHEWGTITTRHKADGTPVGGLNKIEPSEVLPKFVHLYEPPKPPEVAPLAKQAAVPGRPDVTMRLETPVIYFYPKVGAKRQHFQVSVKFRGGIINEFYPNAAAAVEIDNDRINMKMSAGVINQWDGKVLDNYVLGSLNWSDLSFSSISPPQTDMPVWLAPRGVNATSIATGGEGEKYLFYRGVAHLDALFRTQIETRLLKLSSPSTMHWSPKPSLTIPAVWLARLEGGKAGFKDLGTRTIGGMGFSFFGLDDPDLIPIDGGVDKLRSSIRAGLIAKGLYPDEADALLNTWSNAYFQKSGLRLFYIVPREWIDYFLPLEISAPSELTRVLIGRIDLEE